MSELTENIREEDLPVKLKSYTCDTCKETRDLLAFYDGTHRVWLTIALEVVVDHGEAGEFK